MEKMSRLIRWGLIAALVLCILTPGAALAGQGGPKITGSLRAPTVSIENAYIKVVAADDGAMVMGTTGGDPNIAGDENKTLLFGYPDRTGTGYPSLRVIKSGATHDYILISQPTSSASVVENGALVTRWLIEDVEVTQRISLFVNPYSNLEDMALIAYTVRNTGNSDVQAGIRCMLDIQVGENDFAPFLLPGVGRVATEMEFSGANAPEYLKAFESPTYAADSLRALGILKGFGMTTPDRFALVTWDARRGEGQGIYNTLWDYALTSGARIGDSAAAWWWNPRSLGAGQQVTFQTSYGLGGAGGGTAWFDAPARLTCGNTRFTANLWVSNSSAETLMNGHATITLPTGLRLAAGQSATQPIANVAYRTASSVSWQIEADAQRHESLTYQASVVFENQPSPLVVTAVVEVPDCRATRTPTGLPTVTPTPRPGPEVPEPNSILLVGAGLAGLAALIRRRCR
jgi:hypothetical protein